jgi:hypothetical protein
MGLIFHWSVDCIAVPQTVPTSTVHTKDGGKCQRSILKIVQE